MATLNQIKTINLLTLASIYTTSKRSRMDAGWRKKDWFDMDLVRDSKLYPLIQNNMFVLYNTGDVEMDMVENIEDLIVSNEPTEFDVRVFGQPYNLPTEIVSREEMIKEMKQRIKYLRAVCEMYDKRYFYKFETSNTTYRGLVYSLTEKLGNKEDAIPFFNNGFIATLDKETLDTKIMSLEELYTAIQFLFLGNSTQPMLPEEVENYTIQKNINNIKRVLVDFESDPRVKAYKQSELHLYYLGGGYIKEKIRKDKWQTKDKDFKEALEKWEKEMNKLNKNCKTGVEFYKTCDNAIRPTVKAELKLMLKKRKEHKATKPVQKPVVIENDSHSLKVSVLTWYSLGKLMISNTTVDEDFGLQRENGYNSYIFDSSIKLPHYWVMNDDEIKERVERQLDHVTNLATLFAETTTHTEESFTWEYARILDEYYSTNDSIRDVTLLVNMVAKTKNKYHNEKVYPDKKEWEIEDHELIIPKRGLITKQGRNALWAWLLK